MSNFPAVDATGTTQNIPFNPNGPADETAAKPIVLSNQDRAQQQAILTAIQSLLTIIAGAINPNGDLQTVLTDASGNPVDPTAAAAIIGGTQAGSPISFAPVTTGGKVMTAAQAALANNNVTDAWFDPLGRQSMTFFPLDVQDSQQSSVTNSTSAVTIVTAGGAGKKRHILNVLVTNESTTNSTLLTFSDGTKSRKFWAVAGQTVGVVLPGSPWEASSAATAWTVTCAVANTSQINFDVNYVEI